MLYSGLQFPFPGDLPDPGPEPVSPASPVLAGRFFTTAPPGKLFSSSGLSNAMPILITPYTTWCFPQGSWPDCQMVEPRLPWCPQQREHHIPPSCHYHMLWMPPATLLPLMQMDVFPHFIPKCSPLSWSVIWWPGPWQHHSSSQLGGKTMFHIWSHWHEGVAHSGVTQPHQTVVPVHEAPRFCWNFGGWREVYLWKHLSPKCVTCLVCFYFQR